MYRNDSRDWQYVKKIHNLRRKVSKCDYKKYEMYKKLEDFCLEKKKTQQRQEIN